MNVRGFEDCPFCGSQVYTKKDKNKKVHIECLNCGCKSPLKDNEKDLIDIWNKRA